jgi:uncharacterized protein (TIGR03000 family)
MKKFIVFAAFGLVALFVAQPTQAAAGYFGRYIGWGPRAFVYPRFYWRAWRPYYYSNASAAYYYPDTVYYPPAETGDVNTVTIRMHVPEGARIWFNGKATSQTGLDRTFETASLLPGRDYVYQVRVQWDENGKAVERTRDLTVHAGDRINLTIDK